MTPKNIEPFPESPGEREIRHAEVVRRLQDVPGLSDELREALLGQTDWFIERQIVRADRRTHFYGFQLGWTKYAIRNDHLDLVASAGPVAVALAGLATATAPVSPVPVAVGLMFASLSVATKIYRKSAPLGDDAYAVLMAVKSLGKATTAQIQSALVDIRIYPIGKWSLATIDATLRTLQEVRLRDGSMEAFVVADLSGSWSTNGV